MKKISIYEKAMCCPTGLCGVGVDTELLRVSTVLDTLLKHGITIERFNLTSTPMEFVKNNIVNEFLREKGDESLPLVLIDGSIAMEKRYPTNEEFIDILEIPKDYLTEIMPEESNNTTKECCSGGSCC